MQSSHATPRRSMNTETSKSRLGSSSKPESKFHSCSLNVRRSPRTKPNNGFMKADSSASALASLKTNHSDATRGSDSKFSRTSSNASSMSGTKLPAIGKDSLPKSLYAPSNAKGWCFDAFTAASKESDRLRLHRGKFFYREPKQMEKKSDLRGLRIGLRTQLIANVESRHYHTRSRDVGHTWGRSVGVCS